MAALQRAKLTINADVDGDGSDETGVFEMAGDLQVVPSLRTGYLIGGRGSTVNAIISSTVADGENKRKGFFLDLGGGAHVVEIQFKGWDGAKYTDSNGNVQTATWGDTSKAVGSKANATGEGPVAQMDVLMKYLSVAEIDSRDTATLEYGEYSSPGRYDPISVVIEGPSFQKTAMEEKEFTGSLTCIAAQDITEAADATLREIY